MTLFVTEIQDDRREDTSPHHAWKVEYSSKPRGVGNPWERARGIYDRNETANAEKKPGATESPSLTAPIPIRLFDIFGTSKQGLICV